MKQASLHIYLQKGLQLSDCLGLHAVDRLYYISANDINPKTGKAYAINPVSGNYDDNYFAKNYGGVSSPGTGGVGSGDLTSYLQSQKDAQDKLLAGQQQKQQDFLGRYSAATQALPSAQSVYDTASQNLGLQPAQQNVANLETNIQNLPDEALQRAQRLGLNASQMQEYVGVQSGLRAPALTAASNILGAKEQDLQALLSGQMQQNQQKLAPYQTEAGFISDNAARQTSLFSQADQQTFTSLLDKVKNDETISAAEVAQINALAIKNQDYQNEISKYKQFPTLAGAPWYAGGGTSGGSTGYTSNGAWNVVQ